MRNISRALVVSAGFLLAAPGVVAALEGTAFAQSDPAAPKIVGLDLTGVVDPFVARYVEEGIRAANDAADNAVLLTIDTPGGDGSSMRRIMQSIDGSRVAVICYVAPSGARAASAGTFVLYSCPIAAMAPGTNVGAAHPVGVSGAIESGKVLNDAVSTIRSQAELRGRNADWAEQAVRNSVSVSAERALELNVIDLIAPTRTALLDDLDGMRIETAPGTDVTLDTAGVPVESEQMGPVSFLLHSLITPDFAYLFFVLGLILIVIELLHPGVSVPGILGALFLVFSFISFGMLPIDLAGVVFLVIAAGFFLLELQNPGVGLPAVGGVSFLVLGGFFLFDRAVPQAQVSPWLIAVLAALALLFFGIVVRASLRARHLPPAQGLERLVGSEGRVVRMLNPQGVVQVAAEEWSASCPTGSVPRGATVHVVGVEGLRLLVEPASPAGARDPAIPGVNEGSDP